MTPSLWAPYDDAIKLILTGSDDILTANMSSEQQTIYKEMIALGLKDDAGNLLKERDFPGVQIEQYCIDEENDEYQTFYHILDLYMYIRDKWNVSEECYDKNYIESVRELSVQVDNDIR